jgi:alkylhydroperoxidase/carboxymuconolactone decarboxylase family protein YurZ
MRLGLDAAGVTELMGVAEHAHCLNVVADSLLLDGGEAGALVRQPDPATLQPAATAALDEIRAWAAGALGQGEVPLLWRLLARNHHYLVSTWEKERVVMREDRLTVRDKRRVALAIAMNGRSRAMIRYHDAILRHAGETDEDHLEVLGVVDHYNCLNTMSEAMQIESDIRPPA